MNNTLHNLLREMNSKVDEKLTNYKTDFYLYDIVKITTEVVKNGKFEGFWFLRNTGTHLITKGKNDDMYELYKDNNEIAYSIYVDENGYKLEKIWEK